MTNRPWTPAEDAELRRLIGEKYSGARIAAKIKRTLGQIEGRKKVLGIRVGRKTAPPELLARLRRGFEADEPLDSIAAATGLTVAQVRAKRDSWKNNLQHARPAPDHVAPPPRKRPCLRCRQPFRSTWAGDRVCPRCENTNEWRLGI